MNMKTAGTCIVEPNSRSHSISIWKSIAAKAAVIAALLCGGAAVHATSYNWVGATFNNYTNPSAWSPAVEPGVADTAVIGNSTTASALVMYTNTLPIYFSTNRLTVLKMGAVAGASAFDMSDGILWITNSATAWSLGNFSGAVDTFSQSGGTLVVARPSTGNLYYQDAALPGNLAGANGIYTNSGGFAYFLCGVEVGALGSGTFSVNGGIVVDNGWFGQRGGGASTDTSTFNLNSGSMYILRNPSTDGTGNAGGLAFGQSGYTATANITGGNLYCTAFRFTGTANNPKETVNMVGGTVYLGYLGVYTNGAPGSSVYSINIGGGTFRTADMTAITTGTIGSTNSILSDGVNWTWAPSLGVVLKDNTFSVDGVTGPGYVTFAPEATRTISLSNIWSGVGGMVVSGPGTLAVGAANTYTGPTTVNGGVLGLGLNGSIASSSLIQVSAGGTLDASGRSDSTLTLASGQTLGGSGTVIGTLSVGSGATNGAGTSTSIGTLNNTGSTLLNGGGTLTVKVQNATTGAGVGNDSIAVSGNIGVPASGGGQVTVKLVSLDGAGVAGNSVTNFNNATNYTWTIATGTLTNFDSAAFTIDTSAFGNALGGGQFFVDTTGSSLVVYFKPANSTASGKGGSIASATVNGSGNPTFSGNGIPGYIYGVESATSLAGPWIEAGTATGASNGAISFTDLTQTNPPTIFYRLYYPDNPGNPPQ
jgi:fibronectin-binding autotransporter adhesin